MNREPISFEEKCILWFMTNGLKLPLISDEHYYSNMEILILI
jgi:hypothetical protein